MLVLSKINIAIFAFIIFFAFSSFVNSLSFIFAQKVGNWLLFVGKITDFLFFTKTAIHKILVTITRVEPSVVINFIISIIVDVSPKMDIIKWYTGKSNKIIIKSPYNLKISEHNTNLS